MGVRRIERSRTRPREPTTSRFLSETWKYVEGARFRVDGHRKQRSCFKRNLVARTKSTLTIESVRTELGERFGLISRQRNVALNRRFVDALVALDTLREAGIA